MGRRAPPSTHKALNSESPPFGAPAGVAGKDGLGESARALAPLDRHLTAPKPGLTGGLPGLVQGPWGKRVPRVNVGGVFSLLLRGRSGDGVSAGIALVAFLAFLALIALLALIAIISFVSFIPFLALRARRPRVTLRT